MALLLRVITVSADESKDHQGMITKFIIKGFHHASHYRLFVREGFHWLWA
jgi:hypothetical protein